MLSPIEKRIAETIVARTEQVRAAVALLDDGATVPFIARYRKEATGGLDDGQLRTLEERLHYLRELEERRSAILASVDEQGKLSDALKTDIDNADTKARLEDLYMPYKPKRRTRAQKARESGLQALADQLRADPSVAPEAQAERFVDNEKDIADTKAALDGARAIIVEEIGEDAALVGPLREWVWEGGSIRASVIEGKEEAATKFRDYFDHAERIAAIPSHRMLALLRARNEGFVHLKLVPPGADEDTAQIAAENRVIRHAGFESCGRPADEWLLSTARLAWRAKLHLSLTIDLFTRARDAAEEAAINVFGDNLKDLLLAAPAGPKAVMGLDPGIRTGVKVAVVDTTGKLVDTTTIYPHPPKRQWKESLAALAALCKKHKVALISIGNGTASRETDKLAGELIKGLDGHKPAKIVVSEAGASVYSASEAAAKEFPELDVAVRGAVSIARRLQDPLAELVKIEPKAIGVGQYQHDVNQVKLARTLDARVEDCVNAVGVDVNTASPSLLTRVAGLSGTVADNIVRYRDEHGAYASRKALLKVPRLGPKAFEQCAGFLRINGGDPLDASSVHPEAYPVVERIVAACGRDMRTLIGDRQFLRGLSPSDYTDERFGVPTVKDILGELEKPGRDPRPDFVAPSFAEGVEALSDLKPGMVLEGRISNVAAFGAFVDIGVHQDGLVHVSALSNKFVKDPREVVKAGDIVKVKVMDVDLQRKRISLSMRLDDTPGETGEKRDRSAPAQRQRKPARDANKPAPSGAMAEAFLRARK